MSTKIVKTKVANKIATIQNEEIFTTPEDLRAYIHAIHNFLRNNGVGYGKNGMMIFSLFYGLKLIQPILVTFKLDKNMKLLLDFNILLEKAYNNDNMIDEYINEQILGLLYNLKTDEKYTLSQRGLGQFLFHQIPRGIKLEVWHELIKRIGRIPVGFTIDREVNLSGKVYEYFVGRDKTAISELGAFFTDRHITNFIFKKLNITTNESGNVPTMADVFGGSGGFTLGYANHFRENFDIKWEKNVDNIYHFDMEETVINMTGLEMFAITNCFPDRENNYKRENSFTNEFNKDGKPMKFKFIISNPPYGGDKTERNAEQQRRDKILSKIDTIYKEVNDGIEDKSKHKKIADNILYNKLKKETKNYFEEQDKHHVNLKSCSKRIKGFAKKYNLDTANDKESCSLILLADLLDDDGVCCAVLKEGVFFDGKYSKLRQIILENYNVTDIISIASDSFENTTTKTSVIIFQNNGKTKKVNFSELVVSREEDDVFTEGTIDIMKLEEYVCSIKNNKGMIKDNGVNEKIICTATIKQISAPTITKKNGKTNEKFNYSLNYKDYKDFIIDCPEGFELKTLGDIANINPDSIPFNKDIVEYEYIEISDIYNNNIVNKTNINKQNIPKGSKRRPLPNDILICSVRPNINKIVYLNQLYYSKNMLISGAIYNLRFINNLESVYVYNYFLLILDSFLKTMGNGSSYPRISPEVLKNIQIPFPKDITKIKPILDKLYALHQSIAQMTESIPLKEKHICDTIKKATDEGAEGVDYNNLKIGDISNLKDGYNFYKNEMDSNNFYKLNINLPLIKNNGGIITDYILINNKYDKYIVNKNDILIGTAGTCGRIYKSEFTRAYHVHNMPCFYDIKINKSYFYYYILYYFNIDYIKNNTSGSVLRTLKMDTILNANIKILIENKMKQHKLQELFDEVDTLKETLVQTNNKYKELTEKLFKDFKKPEIINNLQSNEETLSTESDEESESDQELTPESEPESKIVSDEEPESTQKNIQKVKPKIATKKVIVESKSNILPAVKKVIKNT